MKQTFSIIDVLKIGWSKTLANIWTFVVFILINFVFYALLSQLNSSLEESPISFINYLINMFVSLLFSLIFAKFTLDILDGVPVTISSLPSYYTRFISHFFKFFKKTFFVYMLVPTLVVIVGIGISAGIMFLLSSSVSPLIVFILNFLIATVLGIFLITWIIKYMFIPYIYVEDPNSDIRAISAVLTKGETLHLMGFGIVGGFVFILGFLALIVGAFITYPMVGIATAAVYRQLSKKTSAYPVEVTSAPVVETL